MYRWYNSQTQSVTTRRACEITLCFSYYMKRCRPARSLYPDTFATSRLGHTPRHHPHCKCIYARNSHKFACVWHTSPYEQKKVCHIDQLTNRRYVHFMPFSCSVSYVWLLYCRCCFIAVTFVFHPKMFECTARAPTDSSIQWLIATLCGQIREKCDQRKWKW